MSNLYTIGQMNEHADALERNGWTPADVKKASSGDILVNLLSFVRAYGEVSIAMLQHIINCDVKPFEPNSLMVVSESEQIASRVHGQFTFDPAKVKLHFSPNQQEGKYIVGTKLKKELEDRPVFTAHVLDFYLANLHLISEEWKGKAVFFWGTIYRDADGYRCVRYLYFDDGRWYSRCHWLDSDWDGRDPAAVRAS